MPVDPEVMRRNVCHFGIIQISFWFSLQDQYQLCYRAALEYLGSFDHYAT